MFIVVTEPIYTIEDWVKPHRKEKQEYWTMIIFAASFVALFYLSVLQMIGLYFVLLTLNIIIYAIWNKFKKRI
jgi:uncharacterized membrane protein